MKVKKFCATATLLAAACAMQAGALVAEAPAATGTATQSTVGAAVTATNQTASTDAATGEPLIGATVQVKGVTIGTTTELNGMFSINLPANRKTLLFSYVGYEAQEIAVGRENARDGSQGSFGNGDGQLQQQ